jgi:formimidoylglutamate deiminase
MMTKHHIFKRALTPDGWRDQVAVTVGADGRCTHVESGVHAPLTHKGYAIPGVTNVHSHTFQRGMAGLAERAAGADQFWSWRDVMYRFALSLSPDDVEVIATQAFLEMVEAGFTGVAEFHYLHHAPDGSHYADPAELAQRIIAAADTVGLRLTLLPVFYAHGGADGRPPEPSQRRFIHSLDSFAPLMDGLRAQCANVPRLNVGLAPHSLRAATLDQIKRLVSLAMDQPIHIHASEQTREIEEVSACLGARPIEILLDRIGLDQRWCIVHATHMTAGETHGLATSGAVAGLCPITEANLGDGIFDGVAYLAAGGRYGVGSDSNVRISVADELRTLEYSQRLRDRARNRLTGAAPVASGRSGTAGISGSSGTARTLLDAARQGGASASGTIEPAFAIGAPADFVVLDAAHPTVVGRQDDDALNGWIFSGDNAAIDSVIVGGAVLVRDGRHQLRAQVRQRFSATMTALASKI